MKNIGKIFCADMRSLTSRFLALVVALALCVAPGMFAWANIYADWDPYSSTDKLPIALCVLDKGWDDGNGSVRNMGQELVRKLTSENAINWIVTEDEDSAIEGVYAGDYYGAVVLEEDFSYKIENMLTEWTGKPTVTYYQNGKKNTVGNLMADTAVGKVQTWLTKGYLEIISAQLLEETNSTVKTFKESSGSDSLIDFLDETVTLLDSAIDTIDSVLDAKENSSDYIDPEALSALMNRVNEISGLGAATQYTSAKLCFDLNTMLNYTQGAVTVMERYVHKLNEGIAERRLERDESETLQAVIETLQQNTADIERLAGYIDALPQLGIVPEVGAIIHDLAGMSSAMSGGISSFIVGNDAADILKDLETLLGHGRQLTSRLIPTTQELAAQLDSTFRSLSDTLGKTKILSYQAELLMSAADMTLQDLNDVLVNIRPLAVTAADSLSRLDNSIKAVKDRGYLEILIDFLDSNPELYSEYLSSIVEIETVDAYPMDNFGSAMAPFYSVIGIWMGAMLLVVCFKCFARTDGLVRPKLSQLFFGRYIMFFILAMLQSLVIAMGDLHLLKIQCANPDLFITSCLVTGFVFSLLCYALVVAFGNVGKGIVMIGMALQVAASTGTFPLELLPEGFRNVYMFFPAPYAIDAMRAAIFGVYGNDYTQSITKLLIFAAAALVIGLIVRKPFARVNDYAEKELAETGLF